MKIKVTQDHIDAGVSQSGHMCPIALALAEAGFDEPHVSYQFFGVHSVLVGVKDGNKLHWYFLNKKACNFVQAFDNHLSVRPFTFTI